MTKRAHRGVPARNLNGPDEVVAAVPYLLGFTPTRSCVVIALNGSGDVLFTCRVDLPPAEEVPAWSDCLGQSLSRATGGLGRRALLVAFADEDEEALVRSATESVVTSIRGLGMEVLDRLWCREGRWSSLDCDDPECCPVGGRIITRRALMHARDCFPGHPCAESREALARSLEHVPGDDASAVQAELAAMASEIRGTAIDEPMRDIAIAHAVHQISSGPEAPRDVALALAGLRDVRVRDTVLWDLLHGPRESWAPMVVSLEHLVRLAPAGDVAPVATLLGVLEWQRGNGTKASMATERALADDPDYALAALIDTCVVSGLPPGLWLRALQSLTREECRRAA